VARELAPAGLRSSPKHSRSDTSDRSRLPGLRPLREPSGGKPPRHTSLLPHSICICLFFIGAIAMNTSTAKAHIDLSQPQRKSRVANPGWFLVSPSVALLLLWMIVPLGMTIYFSLIRYNLLNPGENEFVGLENFTYFLTDSGFLPGATNTLLLVGSVLLISVVLGVLISALLEASEFLGRGIVRVMLISPFFIMPTVGALIWKNLIFHPVSGILAYVWRLFGAQPVDWLAHYPLLSIIIIVSWQWLPFAILILMTAMQSLDQEQKRPLAWMVPARCRFSGT
jgi:sorbitol/mannitol transport system permease protein